MAKFQSPLLGYNNNVRHKNRVFHIQTEDSGVNHPHIITHLFMDGGRILKSVKKSYAEHVGAEGMSETVRGLMKEQHKAMFIALRDGQFDALVDGGTAPKPASAPTPKAATAPVAAATPAAAPPVVAAPVVAAPVAPAPAVAPPVAVVAAPVAPAPAAAPPVVAAPVVAAPVAPVPAPPPVPAAPSGAIHAPVMAAASAPATHAAPPRAPVETIETGPATIDDAKRPAASVAPPSSAAHTKAPRVEEMAPPAPRRESVRAPGAPRLVLADDADDVPMTTRQPPEARPDAAVASASAAGLTLDFDALEHAAQDEISPSLFHSADLPPPPKNLFAKEPSTGGAYRAVEADPRHDAREEPATHAARPQAPLAAAAPPQVPPAPGPQRGEPSPQPPPRTPSTRSPAARPAEARYAPARPAAIFGSGNTRSTQRPPPASLFSDELVSDKSLDEVILSYLAEDLEPPRRK